MLRTSAEWINLYCVLIISEKSSKIDNYLNDDIMRHKDILHCCTTWPSLAYLHDYRYKLLLGIIIIFYQRTPCRYCQSSPVPNHLEPAAAKEISKSSVGKVLNDRQNSLSSCHSQKVFIHLCLGVSPSLFMCSLLSLELNDWFGEKQGYLQNWQLHMDPSIQCAL